MVVEVGGWLGNEWNRELQWRRRRFQWKEVELHLRNRFLLLTLCKKKVLPHC